MARSLDWISIRKDLIRYIICRWNLPQNDAEDLVEDSITTALEKWDPFREKDWSQPGFGLTRGILDNLVKKYFDRDATSELGNADTAVNTIKDDQEERLYADELTNLIDSWLDENLDLRVATAFILDVVYGVPKEICGMIAFSKWDNPEVARKRWYRKLKKIRKQLKRYLL